MSRKPVEKLISSDAIAVQVSTIANRIAKTMPKDLMVVLVLRGSFVFAADLIRALHAVGMYPQVDFLTLTSYGKNKTSSGSVEIVRDLTESMEGRDVLIVDDILESGHTLHFACELIKSRAANSIKTTVLLDKPGKRKFDIKADYVGFNVEDKFVVGYGLDYANYYRELPYIGAIIGD